MQLNQNLQINSQENNRHPRRLANIGLKGVCFIMINPKTVKELAKLAVTTGPAIAEAIKKIRKKLKKREEDLTASEPLPEDLVRATQEYGKKLQQHVKVINRNSKVLAEHTKIIEEIAVQSENLATLVNVFVWIASISFAIAVTAVLIAFFK